MHPVPKVLRNLLSLRLFTLLPKQAPWLSSEGTSQGPPWYRRFWLINTCPNCAELTKHEAKALVEQDMQEWMKEVLGDKPAEASASA